MAADLSGYETTTLGIFATIPCKPGGFYADGNSLLPYHRNVSATVKTTFRISFLENAGVPQSFIQLYAPTAECYLQKFLNLLGIQISAAIFLNLGGTGLGAMTARLQIGIYNGFFWRKPTPRSTPA